jgi:hypothetical protein
MAYELLETAIDNKIELINLDFVLANKYSNYTKYNNNFGRAMMPIPQELY